VARARALAKAQDAAITLSEHARLWWSGSVVAKLSAGAHPLSPIVELLADDLLKGDLREAVQKRLETWVTDHIARLLEPVVALRNAAEARTSAWDQGGLPGPARGLAFRLAENLGQLDGENGVVSPDMRVGAQTLNRFGVRVGSRAIFLPRLIRPAPSALAALLWAVHARMANIPSPPMPGLTSFPLDENGNDSPDQFLAAAFFRKVAGRAVRLDILGRIEESLADAARRGRDADETLTSIVSLLGCSPDAALTLAGALGWKRAIRSTDGEERPVWQRIRAPYHSRRNRTRGKPVKVDSPFAGLAGLIIAD